MISPHSRLSNLKGLNVNSLLKHVDEVRDIPCRNNLFLYFRGK